MVVGHLDGVGAVAPPSKDDPPLVVDANRVIPAAIASERFEPVPRRHREIAEARGGVGKDWDHKVDLACGGGHDPNNIWAFDSSVNRSIGSIIGRACRRLCEGTRIKDVVFDYVRDGRPGARLATHNERTGAAQVRTQAPTGATVTPDRRAAGTYDFLADRSGTYEVSFQLLGPDGKVFHVDHVTIEIPAIPGLGR